MPTLLSLLGLPIPRAVEGSDYSRHVTGDSVRTHGPAYLQGMGTTAAWKDGTEWRAIRDAEYLYAVYRVDGQELLFDLRADPFQLKNLAGERAQRSKLNHYRAQLRCWMKEHNDTFESCTWYERNWTVDRNIVKIASGVGHDPGKLKELMKRTYGASGSASRRSVTQQVSSGHRKDVTRGLVRRDRCGGQEVASGGRFWQQEMEPFPAHQRSAERQAA